MLSLTNALTADSYKDFLLTFAFFNSKSTNSFCSDLIIFLSFELIGFALLLTSFPVIKILPSGLVQRLGGLAQQRLSLQVLLATAVHFRTSFLRGCRRRCSKPLVICRHYNYWLITLSHKSCFWAFFNSFFHSLSVVIGATTVNSSTSVQLKGNIVFRISLVTIIGFCFFEINIKR